MLKPRFSRASTFYNLLLSLPLVSYLYLLIFFLNDLWFNIHPFHLVPLGSWSSNTSHLTVLPIMSKFLVWRLTNFKWILSKYCASNFNSSAYSKFVLWIYILNTKQTNVPVVDKNKEREKNSKHPKRERAAYDCVDSIKVFLYLALISLTKQEQQLHIGMGSCRATGCDIIKNRQERIKSADTISTPAASSNWAIHCYHCSIQSVDVHSSGGKKEVLKLFPKE